MADTERTLSALLSLFADNSSYEISPQDLRDLVVSLVAPRGSYYVADGDSAETTIASSGQWTKIAGTTTTGASEVIRDFEHVSDNRLKYTGTTKRDVSVTASLTVETASNNTDLEFAVALNGTVEASSEQDQFFKTATEKENVAMTTIVTMEEDDYLEIFAKNETDSTNLTATRMQLVATGFLD